MNPRAHGGTGAACATNAVQNQVVTWAALRALMGYGRIEMRRVQRGKGIAVSGKQ